MISAFDYDENEFFGSIFKRLFKELNNLSTIIECYETVDENSFMQEVDYLLNRFYKYYEIEHLNRKFPDGYTHIWRNPGGASFICYKSKILFEYLAENNIYRN